MDNQLWKADKNTPTATNQHDATLDALDAAFQDYINPTPQYEDIIKKPVVARTLQEKAIVAKRVLQEDGTWDNDAKLWHSFRALRAK